MPSRRKRPHPLAPVADRIDPSLAYTVRDIAGLLGIKPAALSYLVAAGWFTGSRMRPVASGSHERWWTGARLRRLAQQQVVLDHERFTPLTLWRLGCRCPDCTAAHSATDRAYKRQLADQEFPAEVREQLLARVRDGESVKAAAKAVGTAAGHVYGRAAWDSEFAEALDEAGRALCVLGEGDARCGTSGAYKGNQSLSAPRPPCRGTACRLHRREQSRRERA